MATSGCLVFQIPASCLNTDWTIDLSTLKFHIEETKRYSRSLPGLEMINDTYKTIETFLWFKSWFKNYFLTTALHQINSFLLIISSILGIYLYFKKKLNIERYDALSYTILYCTVLYCTIFDYTVMYYDMIRYDIL